MRREDLNTFKRTLVFVFFFGLLLVSGFCLLICVICILVGLGSTHLDGFWVPIFAGALGMCLILCFSVPIVRVLLKTVSGGSPETNVGAF